MLELPPFRKSFLCDTKTASAVSFYRCLCSVPNKDKCIQTHLRYKETSLAKAKLCTTSDLLAGTMSSFSVFLLVQFCNFYAFFHFCTTFPGEHVVESIPMGHTYGSRKKQERTFLCGTLENVAWTTVKIG